MNFIQLNLLSTIIFSPGFHEAVSDAIGLSIFTPQHLHKIGLHNNLTDDYDSSINFLMLMALRKVAYVPFAYIVDQVTFSKIVTYIMDNIENRHKKHIYFFKVEMARL